MTFQLNNNKKQLASTRKRKDLKSISNKIKEIQIPKGQVRGLEQKEQELSFNKEFLMLILNQLNRLLLIKKNQLKNRSLDIILFTKREFYIQVQPQGRLQETRKWMLLIKYFRSIKGDSVLLEAQTEPIKVQYLQANKLIGMRHQKNLYTGFTRKCWRMQ